jgi:hypothetical protein
VARTAAHGSRASGSQSAARERAGESARHVVRRVVGRQRAREVVALREVAAQPTQAFELVGGLDPLRDHVHAEAVRQRHDRPDDLLVAFLRGRAAHERLVDLDGVEREAVQVAERGIAGPEVVDGQLDAVALELLERARHELRVLQDDALGDLQLEAAGAQARLAHDAEDLLHAVRMHELPPGQVDVHGQVPRGG